MLVVSLLLLPLALAALTVQQLPFSIHDDRVSSSGSTIPPLKREAFTANHTLISLPNDGPDSFVPSPAFGVGSIWKGTDVTELVLSALASGYRHLDNSPFYANEQNVGEAIRRSGIAREDLYLTTKYDRMSNESVEAELHKSLEKLGTSYIDLLLIHSPFFAAHDPAGVWASFESLVEQGLVRSIGVSNYDVRSLRALLALPNLKIKPAINQIKLSPYNTLQQFSVIELAEENDIRTAAYSALTPLTQEPGGKLDPVLKRIAEDEGITEGQVILDWVKGQNIAVVTTSGKEYRQREQLEVFSADFPRLTKEEVKELEKAGQKQELKNGRPEVRGW